MNKQDTDSRVAQQIKSSHSSSSSAGNVIKDILYFMAYTTTESKVFLS